MTPRSRASTPGTISFDVCVLDDGEVILERSFSTEAVGADPAPLVETLTGPRPLPARARPGRLRAAARPRRAVGERELSLMVLCAPTSREAVSASAGCARSCARSSPPAFRSCSGRERSTCRRSRATGMEPHRSGDGGQGRERSALHRRPVPPAGRRLRRHLFRHARARWGVQRGLAIDAGRIVDGIGGSAGPIGARACGALDAEVAYLSAARCRSARCSAAARSIRAASSIPRGTRPGGGSPWRRAQRRPLSR